MISAPPQLGVRPVQVQVTGTADASGEWRNSPGVQIHNSNWAIFKLVATCGTEYGGADSTVRWEISTGGNRPLDFARGADASTGPMLTGPGEMVNVSCTGAQPGAQIRGQLTGVMASHVADIIQQFVPAPNPQAPGADALPYLSAIQQALERLSPPPGPTPPPFVIQGSTSS